MSKYKVFGGVGHGGSDPGATNSTLKLKESELNLKQALFAEKHLKRHNIEVLLSRYREENDDLAEEIRECNAFNPDLAIDFHTNAGGGIGFEAIHSVNKNSKGVTLANNIDNEIVKAKLKSRGCKTKVNSSGVDYFGFIRQTTCPSIITEMAFIDNKSDIQNFDEDHEIEAYAICIVKGILKTLGVTWIENNIIPPANNKPDSPQPSKLYRVRKSWSDSSSQKGAFSDIENAKVCADEFKLNVYDENGVCIYESVKVIPVDKNAFWNTCNAHAKVKLNSKSAASLNSSNIGEIYINEKVKLKAIVSDNNTLLPIQFYKSSTNSIIDGWVECNISKLDIHFKNKVINVTSKLLARYSPTSSSDSFGQVYNNESLIVLKEENGFKLCAYRTTDGYAKIGWFTGIYIR